VNLQSSHTDLLLGQAGRYMPSGFVVGMTNAWNVDGGYGISRGTNTVIFTKWSALHGNAPAKLAAPQKLHRDA